MIGTLNGIMHRVPKIEKSSNPNYMSCKNWLWLQPSQKWTNKQNSSIKLNENLKETTVLELFDDWIEIFCMKKKKFFLFSFCSKISAYTVFNIVFIQRLHLFPKC